MKQLEANGDTEIIQGGFSYIRISLNKERLHNSYCYKYTAWKKYFPELLINNLDFFFQTYKLYNEGLKFILHRFHFFNIATF